MTTGQLTPTPQSADPAGRHLLQPTYQNRLRVIGRALDEHELEQALIVELDETLLLRAYNAGEETFVSETFTDERLLQTLRMAVYARGQSEATPYRSPLHPTGYEDFLRALGHRLDERGAEAVVIVECPKYFQVSGRELLGNIPNLPTTPFAEMYEVPKVNNLVNEAVSRRADPGSFDAPLIQFVEPIQPTRILRTGSRST